MSYKKLIINILLKIFICTNIIFATSNIPKNMNTNNIKNNKQYEDILIESKNYDKLENFLRKQLAEKSISKGQEFKIVYNEDFQLAKIYACLGHKVFYKWMDYYIETNDSSIFKYFEENRTINFTSNIEDNNKAINQKNKIDYSEEITLMQTFHSQLNFIPNSFFKIVVLYKESIKSMLDTLDKDTIKKILK